MRDNPFSFLRGTAHLFYQRMADAGINPGGPPAWISGDLHLENFGTYLASNGLTYFDINDFDECVLAPCSWDILRLTTSILIASPLYGLSADAGTTYATQAIDAYRKELATGKPRWIERKTASGVIDELMETLRKRDPDKFIQKRTTDKHAVKLNTDLPKMQGVTDEAERKEMTSFVLSRNDGPDGPKAYEVLDLAYRIAGTGSLGIARYVVLVKVLGENRKALLDLKEALPSSATGISPEKQPDWNNQAHRVVAIQNSAQVLPPSLLQAVTIGKHSYVFKELQPTSDRLDLDDVAKDAKEFGATISAMASLTAWSHMRAAGHMTAASPDALVTFAGDAKAAKTILDAAKKLEQATRDDWKEYCAAFDGGAFAATMAHLDKSKVDEAS